MSTLDNESIDDGMTQAQAERVLAQTPPAAVAATNQLFASLQAARSRRGLFRTAAAGAAAMGIGGALLAPSAVFAAGMHHEVASTSGVQDILTVARTAEQLAVTFYTNGINNHYKLGIKGQDLVYLKAAAAEEQIHLNFFAANGGQSLATTFSFPHGRETFEDLDVFIKTQQQLEGVFDSAFLAAIYEFCVLGQPRLAQIAGQVACVEAEHRVLGRTILGLSPADNFVFEPVLIAKVSDAPTVVKNAGYLSPREGNSYTYHAIDTNYPGLLYKQP